MKLYGLPDISIKESKERIVFAIKNSKIQFPSKKIVINLAPADVKKEGASYDLPIAIGILQLMGIIKFQNMRNTILIGELGLDGKVNKVNGTLAMCLEARKFGIKKIILPKENAKEASFIKDIEIIPIENLNQLINYLNGQLSINPYCTEIEKLLNTNEEYECRFEQIYGQENVKRALEIAASGNHNCLIIGSPGTRKDIIVQKYTIYTSRYYV